MKVERIDLYEYFGVKRPSGAAGFLNTYLIERYNYCPTRLRPAMLVIPGGGYAHVSEREEEPIVFQYLAKGFCAFTLDYSITPVTFPAQLIEGCMAIAYIRENAEKFGIAPNLIAAVGFSAGGHLTGMLATMYNEKEVLDTLKEKAKLCRPDAVILSYPVISADEKISHQGSINNLSGGDKSIIERISLEKRVNENSSPAYIWCTVTDQIVPMENSMVMATAYKKAGVPFELHVFENGRHGLSLATEEVVSEDLQIEFYVKKPIQVWIDSTITWLQERGFKIKI